ncbi:MFS general substrate transporter [Trichodelitschia bisporula]|uniref:MFS general substrate transporter n=1 Tax=Trichodelitschia bisporula TaxID=703511 RepID=A0A6G1HL62_9PEZI|nr:MFS general substrate transporter [Trichodelitschia bisporula]
MLLQYFVTTFDSTLMASAHPVITSYFHSSNSASWLSTAFMLTSTAFQPLFARVSDMVGRRPLYIFALTMFIATTAWCALAQSMGSFIAARAFCGLGAGGVMTMASIITNDLVRIEVRGTYQSYINIFFGLGSSCGAAFGGYLCDTIGWRWTFGIQIPPIVLILIAAFITTPHDLGPNLAKHSNQSFGQVLKGFDITGSLLLTTSAAALILGLNLGGNIFPWQHPIIIISLIVSVLAGLLLIRVESRAPRPVMPLAMLSQSPRANLVFSNFFAMIGINTVIFNAPLYFQAVKLDSASMSGFRLALPSASLTVCAVGVGFFMTRTGRMYGPIVAGSLSMIIGASCLAAMWDGIPMWLATAFVIPPSLGQGLMFPVCSVAVLAVSSQADQAVMTSTLSLWRNLGTVMGVAVSSLIVQNSLVVYLNKYITGADKAETINRIRKAVRAIQDLDPLHQHEAMTAYSAALRITFLSAIIFFAITTALALPIKLPLLGRSQPADEENSA